MSYNNGTYGGNNPMLGNEVPGEEPMYEEEEVMIEEEREFTDDEEESETVSSAVDVGRTAGESVTPQASPSTHGKVKPSRAVSEMKMSTPESGKKRNMFAPGTNPFPTFGAWDSDSLSKISIEFPVLTSKNETTNSITKANNPESRYWRGEVIFRCGEFTSNTLRVDNVHIPYHTGDKYGTNYVYMCLSTDLREAFARAARERGPIKVEENSLVPETNRWVKIANNIETSFGIIDQTTRTFHRKSLETIFDATSSGISCSMVLKFFYKASTTDMAQLRPTTIRTISVSVEVAYINGLDLQVPPPTKVSKNKPKRDLPASSKDVASDSVLGRLRQLGL